ncbi:hypothetical protein GLAREA_09363 [Glarea lozoyensis ATCC 20868]|uniref:2EXR domain-containing protein n=1 Tax=Glarea lozoyensis (strain ATCC 20868 / MF5171) TaxID=1116229 RepID=S3DP58_GLAL2|nr:uncharacterized protein GLAREA_09363 [Glarea lozoyensis ATCC 20868]EPE28243.1 hypothetical protein GLAREA_09363 [Glarea lozoyensis ATCC 20868]
MNRLRNLWLARKREPTQTAEEQSDSRLGPEEENSTSFSLFPNLPPEIRLQIWNLAFEISAAQHDRLVEIVPYYTKKEELGFTIHTSRTPRLLGVNREARSELRGRYVNPFSSSIKLDGSNVDSSHPKAAAETLLIDLQNDVLFLHHIPPQPSRSYPRDITAYFNILFGPQSSHGMESLKHMIIPRKFFKKDFWRQEGKGDPTRGMVWMNFPNLERLGLCYGIPEWETRWIKEIVEDNEEGVVRLKICHLECEDAEVSPWGLNTACGWKRGSIRWRIPA